MSIRITITDVDVDALDWKDRYTRTLTIDGLIPRCLCRLLVVHLVGLGCDGKAAWSALAVLGCTTRPASTSKIPR
ncbi:hypothetical protein AB1N83_005059 [Pleurotus pulmonarius]